MSSVSPTALVAAAPTIFRQGLLALFRQRWPQALLTLTADATQLADLVTNRIFRVVVLDDALPGLSLPNLLTRLHQVRPGQRLVVLTNPRRTTTPNCLGGWPGTRLQLSRQAPPAALAATLAPWLVPAPDTEPPVRTSSRPDLASSFSARELQVLRLVVDDLCNEEIAGRLYISVRTVESHRRMLLQKAGTRTLVGLAARAVREGWVA
ncbi:helix-turn-helix transcriptional regulator [Hymenobacter sp. BRD67]|uniref:helix-turn-helix transcriptional regulator n=1 Tax=Hymenobacter sp. BRD67 TaxID=2675877 RepID=UPI0015637E5B|nr:LuxR C-terminal-related transcriptional regulator [Hymenobacter sp. BRD67]QKG54036.1 response regulator transcription factor [Hymenobacter sp. BRD67]